MNLNIYGKNALVCGASKGIGKGAALELAKLGANVTLVSRSPDLMSAVIKEMQMDIDKGQDHDFLKADFSDPDDLKKRILGIAAKRTYHILVNNTGGPAGGPIIEAKAEEFSKAYEQHLICNHLITQILTKGMKEAGYGRVINVISTSVKAPLDNLGVSNTIRAAVANWSKTMSNELGPYGITVNNVLPGFIDTSRLNEVITAWATQKDVPVDELKDQLRQSVPVQRIGTTEEIGSAIAFLATPAASYINGINLPVDGGRTRCL